MNNDPGCIFNAILLKESINLESNADQCANTIVALIHSSMMSASPQSNLISIACFMG